MTAPAGAREPGCREIERALDAYVDGELDASAVLTVDGHLAACAMCAERVAFGRSMKRALRAEAHAEAAPASLRARLLRSGEELAEPAPTSAPARRAVEPSRRSNVVPIESARAPSWRSAVPWVAAAGVAFAIGGSMRNLRSNDNAANGGLATASFASARTQLLEEFAVQHARPLPPEEVDPARVTKVFSPIVGVPVRPVSFANLPMNDAWSFAGARLMAYHDERAATLSYRNIGGARVTVVVYDPNRIEVRSACCLSPKTIRVRGEDRTVLVGHAKGYPLAVSENDGVGYAVSGDLKETELVNLATNF